MTMHMLPIYYSTTNTKKRKKKNKTQSLLNAEKHHAKWRKKIMGGSGERSDKSYRQSVQSEAKVSIPFTPALSNSIPVGIAPKKEDKVYTGTDIIGIATMHKSNAVPVRSKKSAEDISKMRR